MLEIRRLALLVVAAASAVTAIACGSKSPTAPTPPTTPSSTSVAIMGASRLSAAQIGATDTNPSPAIFPDARTGVRAQIQHLRAYADPGATTCTVPPLHNPCVDPRFDLVVPKGKAPTWNQMGNGNWATSSTYANSILTLYTEALAFHGLR